MALPFRCIDGCNHCCIWRDYYHKPNAIRYDPKTGKYSTAYEYFLGKVGTELQPNELPRIKKLIKKLGKRTDDDGRPIEYQILPFTAVSKKEAKEPERTLNYQIMGRTLDGDICPFLSTQKENIRSPSGSLACLIYEERPLICRAYPLQNIYIDESGKKYAKVDHACQWLVGQLKENTWLLEEFPFSEVYGLDYSAMIRVQAKNLSFEGTTLWRYATGVSNRQDKPPYKGWVNWGWD